MFIRVLSVLALGLMFFMVPGMMPLTVRADEPAVIVSVGGGGALDTILSSPSQDITPFLTLYGFDKDMNPITKRVIGFTEDLNPIFGNDSDDDRACPHYCKP